MYNEKAFRRGDIQMARKRIKRKGDSYLRDGLILLAVAVVFAVYTWMRFF